MAGEGRSAISYVAFTSSYRITCSEHLESEVVRFLWCDESFVELIFCGVELVALV